MTNSGDLQSIKCIYMTSLFIRGHVSPSLEDARLIKENVLMWVCDYFNCMTCQATYGNFKRDFFFLWPVVKTTHILQRNGNSCRQSLEQTNLRKDYICIICVLIQWPWTYLYINKIYIELSENIFSSLWYPLPEFSVFFFSDCFYFTVLRVINFKEKY